MKRGRPRLYDWDVWFARQSFALRRDKDYFCSSLSMAQQVRDAACRRGIPVTIEETSVGLFVHVFKRVSADAQARFQNSTSSPN